MQLLYSVHVIFPGIIVQLENKLNKAADKAEQLVNRGDRQARKWYHRLAYGEDLEVKELQVFTTAFAAGVALGLLTGN